MFDVRIGDAIASMQSAPPHSRGNAGLNRDGSVGIKNLRLKNAGVRIKNRRDTMRPVRRVAVRMERIKRSPAAGSSGARVTSLMKPEEA